MIRLDKMNQRQIGEFFCAVLSAAEEAREEARKYCSSCGATGEGVKIDNFGVCQNCF